MIVDHDPRPLRYYLEATHGDGCQWTYLEQGPDVWRVAKGLLRSVSPIVDCGVHYVDVMCQMTGANPVRSAPTPRSGGR